MHLNLLLQGAGHHPQAARLTRNTHRPTSLAYYADIARLAERGRLDSITVLDHLSLEHEEDLQLEPLTLLGALAATTQRIGLIAQVSIQHSQPYNLARRLASLDHASRGRAGWLLDERLLEQQVANFDRAAGATSGSGARAVEYVQVLRKLWDSWQDDARVVDKARGQYVDIRRIQAIDHVGANFRVTGPIDIPRPPQGQPPVIRQGEVIEAGGFADCEAVIVQARDLHHAQQQYRRLAGLPGKPPLALPIVSLICAPSDTQRARLLAQLSDGRSPGGNQPPLLIGRPDQVADELLSWLDQQAADGFSLALPITAEGLEDVVDYLVPELQQRGRFRREYAGSTLREQLGLARPEGRTQANPETSSVAV